MVAIPVWLIGKHVTAISITLQQVASDGTLSPAGGAASLYGFLDEINPAGSATTENIVPLDLSNANAVPIEYDFDLDLVQILRRGAGTNTLANAWYSVYDIAYFTMNRGGDVFGFYGQMTGYREGLRQGKSVSTLTLKQVMVLDGGGFVVANPSVS